MATLNIRNFLGFTGTLLIFSVLVTQCAEAQKARKVNRYFHHAFDSINAHTGICIFNPANGKYVYRLHAGQYFTPASNTKLYSLYAGLSFLGDSTSGIRYKMSGDTLYIQGTGDPSLLHPDYPSQPALHFLQRWKKPIVFINPVYLNKVFGPGWAWDDYSEDYQPERSAMPLYGNVVWCDIKADHLQTMPFYFQKNEAMVADSAAPAHSVGIHREQFDNIFHYNPGPASGGSEIVQSPFRTEEGRITAALLADTLHRAIIYTGTPVSWKDAAQIKNIPVDSLYQHMMYRSDNFFAEQVLQMCSAQLFDTISTIKMIRYMLDTKLKELPDKPGWADGSGLSRYNLFSPRDMVFVLTKLYREFPKERLYNILPTGGKGTLKNLYHNASGYIFAKTGSLANNSALSGYLITKKGKTLIFSILVNNYIAPSGKIRKAMEQFLLELREKN